MMPRTRSTASDDGNQAFDMEKVGGFNGRCSHFEILLALKSSTLVIFFLKVNSPALHIYKIMELQKVRLTAFSTILSDRR